MNVKHNCNQLPRYIQETRLENINIITFHPSETRDIGAKIYLM